MLKKLQHPRDWLSLGLWSGFITALVFVLVLYAEMKHTREHAEHVVDLGNATQQVRHAVAASMLNQRSDLVPLEHEVQYFRYLLLRIKSYTIDDNWENIQQTLLDADSFVEDIDKLLASVYSLSALTKQVKYYHDNAHSAEFKVLMQRIGSYMLFELHGLNDNAQEDKTVRFNRYIAELEAELEAAPSTAARNELFTLYTGLERLNRQLESVEVINKHKFVREITQLQIYWTNQTLKMIDQILSAVAVAFACLVGLIVLNRRKANVTAKRSAPQLHRPEPIEPQPQPQAASLVAEPAESLFDPSVLIEQLEGDFDAIESVLSMFVAEHQDDAKQMLKHLEEKELARARTLIHNLKGVSGNIGAQALQRFCTDVDDKLRVGEWPTVSSAHYFEKLLSNTIEAVIDEMETSHNTTAS